MLLENKNAIIDGAGGSIDGETPDGLRARFLPMTMAAAQGAAAIAVLS